MIPSTYFKENESSYITNSVNNDESVNNFENVSGGHIGPLITSFKPDNHTQGPSTFSGPLPNSVYNSEPAKKSQILDYFIEPNPIVTSQNVTTSNLIQVRNSLNTLRKESRYMSKSSKNDEEQCEDRFYFDDDDTKVIIVKSLD
jgi:hypothetical protein